MTITEQEYFDRACERLRDGTGQAVDADGVCEYLTEDGCKCVVGVFIPDGHKAQEACMPVASLSHSFPDLDGIAWPDTPDGVALAGCLQVAHDEIDNWDGCKFVGETVLVDLALRFNLTYTCPADTTTTTTKEY